MTSFQARHQIDISSNLKSFFQEAWNREIQNPNQHTAIDDLDNLNFKTVNKQKRHPNQFQFYKIDIGTNYANDTFYVAKDLFEGWLPNVIDMTGNSNQWLSQDSKGSQVTNSNQTEKTKAVKSASTHEEFAEGIAFFDDSKLKEAISKRRGGTLPYAISSIPPERQTKLKATISEELKKYPIDLLQNNLESVSIFNKLRFPVYGEGYDYGGTYIGKNIFITADISYGDNFPSITLHHEFSSILLKQFPDHAAKLKESLTKLSGKHYLNYKDGGASFLVKQNKGLIKLTADTEDLYSKGFFSTYGRSSTEEDINETAERLFTGDNKLWDAYNKEVNGKAKYPILREKIHAVINFYQKIYPQYNLAFFQNI